MLGLTLLSPVLIAPIYTLAQTTPTPPNPNGELIPCGNDYNGDHVVSNVDKEGKPVPNEECGFVGLIQLINNVIKWLIKISTLIATGVFMYAGFLLLTSGGNPSKMTQAKAMLLKVVIGYGVILLAWVLVYTIVNALTNPESKFDFIGAFKN